MIILIINRILNYKYIYTIIWTIYHLTFNFYKSTKYILWLLINLNIFYYYIYFSNISNNKIEVIPEEICQMKNLADLDIGSNNIYSLPDDIGNLVSLEKLTANNNKIETIPESIG